MHFPVLFFFKWYESRGGTKTLFPPRQPHGMSILLERMLARWSLYFSVSESAGTGSSAWLQCCAVPSSARPCPQMARGSMSHSWPRLCSVLCSSPCLGCPQRSRVPPGTLGTGAPGCACAARPLPAAASTALPCPGGALRCPSRSRGLQQSSFPPLTLCPPPLPLKYQSFYPVWRYSFAFLTRVAFCSLF